MFLSLHSVVHQRFRNVFCEEDCRSSGERTRDATLLGKAALFQAGSSLHSATIHSQSDILNIKDAQRAC